MPNASPSSRRDTSRASQRSLNAKDPPWSRRVLNAAHAVQAALQANNEKLQASIERRQFECQFAEFYSNWPRDEEYYTLLAECRQTRLALRQASPGATYSFLDILTTTLIQCTTHAEELACEDEHKFKSCLSPSLSSRTHAHSSDLTQLEAVQTFHGGPRIAPSLTNDEKSYEDEPEFEYCSSPLLSPHAGLCSSDSMRPRAPCSTPTIRKVPRVIPPLAKVDEHQLDIHLAHQVPVQSAEAPRDMSPNMAVIEQPELGSVRESPTRDTPEANKEDTLVYDTRITPERVCKTRLRMRPSPLEPSACPSARQTAPCDQNKTVFCGEILNIPHISANAEMHPEERERHLTAVELAEPSLHADVKPLRRVPIPSPPVHGEVHSLTAKQLTTRKAVSEDEEMNAIQHAHVPSAAPSLPKRTPIFSIRAVSLHQSANESQSPPSNLAAPGRHKSLNVVSPVPTVRINAGQATDPGTCPLTPNIAVHRPGVSLPFQGKRRSPASGMPSHQAKVISSTK